MSACPEGWRLPNNAAWQELLRFVEPRCAPDDGNCGLSGDKLRSKIGWYDGLNIYRPGTDEYGFSALPGGNCKFYAPRLHCDDVGKNGYWRSASKHGDGRAMQYYASSMFRFISSKSNYYSVRCLRDNVPDSAEDD